VEHPAVRNLCNTLKSRGYEVTFLRVDEKGMIDLDELSASIRDDTAIVSIMFANNETGVIFPVKEAAEIVKSRGVIFHTDAVQAVGKIEIDVKDLNVDMLSISGHKFHAPKGIGALYIKRGTPFHPYLIGGNQENGRRSGTENVASIVGLGVASRLAREHMDRNDEIRRLRDMLEKGLLESCPDARVNGDMYNRLPNTLNISFEYIDGEAILLKLNEYNICASSGSACSSGSSEPSHVLRAMGVPYTAIHGSIRFSLSRYNTEREIKTVLEVLPEIVKGLRELSPY
jgi:cysteine desulfurase